MHFRKLSSAATLLSVLLLGCQGLAPRQQAVAAPAPGSNTEGSAPSSGSLPASPATELTPDIIYSVLVADIAVQRGQFLVAYEHYLRAARAARDARLAELATRAAFNMEDEGGAAEAVQLWLDLEPESMTARQLAALLAINAGNTVQAQVHLRKIVELGRSTEGDGYLAAARLLARIKDGSARMRLMGELLTLDPDKAEAQFAYGIVAASSGDNAAAEQAARRALELRPRWSEVQVFLVRVLLAEGKKSEATDSLARFVADSPDDLALRTAYARVLVEQESYEDARKEFEWLLAAKPGDPAVLLTLGVLALQTKDHEAARRYLEELLASGQRRDDALFYLGQIEEREGNKKGALDLYTQIRAEHLLEAQIRTARIYAEQGEINRSREVLQRLRGNSPEQAEGLYLIEGEILREVKRHAEAMSVYDEAVKAFPENLDLLYARALQAAHMKRIDILERDLKKILRQEPDHADALNALGYTLADQTDRYAEALSYLKRALELKPNDAAVLDSMGWVQYRLGNHKDALGYLRRAADLLSDAEIAAHLGEVLWADGQREEAQRIWKEALDRDPESEYLRQVIERHPNRGH